MSVGTLRDVLNDPRLPVDGLLTIDPIRGGDQREPFTIGYRIAIDMSESKA